MRKIIVIAATFALCLTGTAIAKGGRSKPADCDDLCRLQNRLHQAKEEQAKREREALNFFFHESSRTMDRMFTVQNQPVWIKIGDQNDPTAYVGFGLADLSSGKCFIALKAKGKSARVIGDPEHGSTWIQMSIGNRSYAARCERYRAVLEARDDTRHRRYD